MNADLEISPAQSLMSFDSRVTLDAVQGLEKSRSDMFLASFHRRNMKIEAEKIRTVWDIKPIDFSVKLFQPCPPPRNSRESMMRGWGSADRRKKGSSEKRSRLVDPSVPQLQLPSLLVPKELDTLPEFEKKFRPPSSQTSRKMFIREGMYHKEPYVTDSVSIHRRDLFRQLENFKQYSKYGIKDFETCFTPDPQNLRFKHQMLSKTLPELSTTKQISIRTCESEPMPRILHSPKWERHRHLPRSAYKKGRSSHSALMERIQAKIGWIDDREKVGHIRRPDIYDHTTKDWCDVTNAPDERNGPFPLA